MNTSKIWMKIEGLILLVLGILHVIYLLLFVEFNSSNAGFYSGGTVYGVIYTLLGFFLFLNKTSFLLPSVILNSIGLTIAITTQGNSIYGNFNIYFIVLDVISVTILLFLNVKKFRSREVFDG